MIDHSQGAGLPGPDRRGDPGEAGDLVRGANRPGVGALVAVAGLVLFALSLLVLPWVHQGGEDLTLADLGRIIGEVNDDNGAFAPQSFKADFLENYAEQLDVRLVVVLAVVVGASTVVVPRSRVVRVVLASSPAWIVLPHTPPALLACGLLGAVITWLDPGDSMGPKVTALVTTVVIGLMHTYVLTIVFGDLDPAPDPAFGVWAGVVGLVAIVAGVAISMATARASRDRRSSPGPRHATP